MDGAKYINGGQGGIRTHDRVTPIPVFETSAFNHSATCPVRIFLMVAQDGLDFLSKTGLRQWPPVQSTFLNPVAEKGKRMCGSNGMGLYPEMLRMKSKKYKALKPFECPEKGGRRSVLPLFKIAYGV